MKVSMKNRLNKNSINSYLLAKEVSSIFIFWKNSTNLNLNLNSLVFSAIKL